MFPGPTPTSHMGSNKATRWHPISPQDRVTLDLCSASYAPLYFNNKIHFPVLIQPSNAVDTPDRCTAIILHLGQALAEEDVLGWTHLATSHSCCSTNPASCTDPTLPRETAENTGRAQTGEVVFVPQTGASVLPVLSNSLLEPLVTLWGVGNEHDFDLGKIPQSV